MHFMFFIPPLIVFTEGSCEAHVALCHLAQQDLSSPFAQGTMCSSETLSRQRSLSYITRASISQSVAQGISIHTVLLVIQSQRSAPKY